MTHEPHGLDPLGLKYLGRSLQTLTEGTVDGAAAFLSRICLPAAEEFGLLLRDRVRYWRTVNMVSIAQKSEKLLIESDAPTDVQAHPRIVAKVLEEGSWVEDELVQEMWAGLLSASCDRDGVDDGNLVFVNILSELTTAEARILNYVCEFSPKMCSVGGLVTAANYIRFETKHLYQIAGIDDVNRLDRELDHLTALDLISGGFDMPGDASYVDLIPRSLGLQLFVRARGSRQSPMEFFKLQPGENEPPFPHPYAMPPDHDIEPARAVPPESAAG